MGVKRIVPNLPATDTHVSREFYAGFLGLEPALDLGWIAIYRPPDDPMVQLSVVTRDETAPEGSTISVGVSDVDEAHAEAQHRGYEIVHPLTEEPWGVRRFFVRGPNGAVVTAVYPGRVAIAGWAAGLARPGRCGDVDAYATNAQALEA